MQLSNERTKALKDLLKEQFGLVYTADEAQEAGLAIMHFILAKELRTVNEKGVKNG